MRRFAFFIIRFRVFFIALTILITALLGFFIKDIKINPDITSYLPKDDSVVARFNYIGTQYSSSSMAILIVESDDVFTGESIEHINTITSIIKNVEGVDYVTSLTNVLDIKTGADSSIEISRLIDEYNLPKKPEELQKLKDYTLSNELYVGRLVSKDSKYATIVCRINQDFNKNEVASNIRSSLSALHYDKPILFEGIPFQLLNIFDYIKSDLLLLVPLIVILIAFTLAISFRSVRGVVLPLVSVGMGIIWTMGMMALCHVPLTPISDAIPVVLFAVGVAYSIHVVNKFNEKITDKERRKEQSVEALAEVGAPVFLAGVTTFMGFLSFIFGAYLWIIRDFGIFSSLGVLFILIISLTFTPAVLSFLKVPRHKTMDPAKQSKHNILGWLMEKSALLTIKSRKAVLFVSLAIIIGSFVGIPLIKNKIDILNYFRESTSIRTTAKLMNAEFGGSLPIQILVKGDLEDPAVLKEVKKFQDYLNTCTNVHNAQSIADYIEQMSEVMGEGKKIPDSRDKISNLWFMIEGDEMLKQLVNTDRNEGIIQAYMTNSDTKVYHEVNNDIDDYISKVKTPGVKFEKSGMPAIYSNLDESLIMNLIQSMILSLILIFICMLLLVKSFKGALVGMIPLLFSMAFIFGFMGIVGIALDIATVLIASITVGAGIDYSIHFVTTYRKFTKQGYPIDQAITETLTTSGKAIVINVATIILGFLVLVFANLLPLQQFGILIAVTMFTSGFAAITLLPAAISQFKITFVKNKHKISK